MSYPNVLERFNSYVPLSGGTMNGTLNFNIDNAIKQHDNKSTLTLFGGMTAQEGGNISLYGYEHSSNPGGFAIRAKNIDTTCVLSGKPDKTLTWCNFDIITSNGGTIRNTLYYGGHDMYCDKDNDIIAIYGSTHHTIGGASLVLHGGIQSDEYGESNISAFKLSTHSYDLSKKKTLYGQYDRGLMWDGNQVVCLVTHWQSGNRWYRKYSNGWIEQGGNWSTANTTLSFNTPFSNTNYTIVGSENQGDDNARAIKFNRNNATTTSIRMVGSANPIGVCWYACGF